MAEIQLFALKVFTAASTITAAIADNVAVISLTGTIIVPSY